MLSTNRSDANSSTPNISREPSMDWNSLDDIKLDGKRVLVRVDYNVPMKDGRVADATRIIRSTRTINEILDKGGFPILLSHLGRPKGSADPKFSLKQVVSSVEKHLERRVRFCESTVGPCAESFSKSQSKGEILLMENVRFHSEETENEEHFVHQLAKLGDIFCNDAFSVSHRAHASTAGLASVLPNCAGRLMAEELEALANALERPSPPVAAVVGGAKISTKLEVLSNLIRKVDYLVIGGGMSNTFYLAQGIGVGKSLAEPAMVSTAAEIMSEAKKHGCEIVLPDQVIVADGLKPDANWRETSPQDCQNHEMILDCGSMSAARIAALFRSCRTLVWNGPMGAFEMKPFENGTNLLARAAAELTESGSLVSVAGGGDTVAALNNAGSAKRFTHVSTAGGAFLEWLEGKTLPGIEALRR